MLRITLFLSASLFACSAQATTTLLQALTAKDITLSAVKNENIFCDKGLNLTLKNNTGKSLTILIDPALIFQPVDTAYQDLVITGDQTIVLAAHQQQTIIMQTFCAKGYAMSPDSGLIYNSFKPGSDNLLKLIRYLKANNIEPTLGQFAVWVITSNHSISNIYDAKYPKQSLQLAAFLAGLLLKPTPDVYTTHTINFAPGKIAYDPKPLKMFAKFEYIAQTDQVLTLGVYNDSGKTIESVFENKPFGKGGHRFTVEFEAADVPKGKYFIRLISNGTVFKEQTVNIE